MTSARWLARPLAGWPGYFYVVVVFATLSLAGYVFGGWVLYRYGDVGTDIGWRSERRENLLVVTSVEPDGPAAGKLQIGDSIVAFNGDPRAATVSLWLYFGGAGSSYALRVLRGSEVREYALSLPILKARGKTLMAARYGVLSLSFFVMALVVGLLRPDDGVARICSLAGFAVALRMLAVALEYYVDFAGPIARLPLYLVHPWHLVLGYQFFYRFCGNLLAERFWSVLRTVLVLGGGILFLMNQAEPVSLLVGSERTIDFFYRHSSFQQIHRFVFSGPHHHFELFALLAMCAALTSSYRRVSDADQRRRLRWVCFGSVAGISPLLLLRIVGLVNDLSGRAHFRTTPGYREMLDFSLMFLIVIPVTLGYAVVKHRVLGIRVVIRSSVKYLLARNVLQAVLLLSALGLLLPILRNPNRPVADLFVENADLINLILLVAISLSLRYRRRLRTWIDRKFFREAYNQEIVLRELIERIRELDSIVEISRLISSGVDAALHPCRLHVFCREQERSAPILGYSSGGATEQLRVPDNCMILKLMEAHCRPEDVPPPRNWELPTAEREWLANLEAQLIVPISSTSGRVAGLLLLGKKKSEEPYSPADRKLLQTLANQMGVVCEKVWLKEQVDEEASELRIARSIQSSALPRDFEPLADGTGLEVHAVMEPARQVGGDLYDVLRLPDGRLLAVLGDVSGKGIPAAMFMMMTTSLLRVAAREGLDGPELLARLNNQLCAANPTSMFVTLACAAVDGAAGRIRYAIAGHTAPALLTAGGQARLLSENFGTIAGVHPGLAFPSAAVELAPGDTFMLYSDGVTEAFDPNGRAFGESGLLAALEGLKAGSAREMVEQLLEAVHAFTAGAEPSDDIAILAMRRPLPIPLDLTVRADRSAVIEATDGVRRWCAAAGVPAGAAHDLELATEEMGINVVVHSLESHTGASFRVRLTCEAGDAVLEIRDAGPPFNPMDAAAPIIADPDEEQPLGGLGIHLVRGLMTRMHWARDGDENVLTLVRALDG